jgi:hypothetical protein
MPREPKINEQKEVPDMKRWETITEVDFGKKSKFMKHAAEATYRADRPGRGAHDESTQTCGEAQHLVKRNANEVSWKDREVQGLGRHKGRRIQ